MSATELDAAMDLLDIVIDTTKARAELAARVMALEAALQKIASTTGRNGHTATNVIELARAVLAAHPSAAPEAGQGGEAK